MRQAKTAAMTRRRLVLALLALAALGIVLRAIQLQLLHKDFLQDQGNERAMRVVAVPAYRGMILDRNDEPLAVSSPVDSVWVNPGLVLGHRQWLPALAQLLDLKVADLERRLDERAGREFAYLRRHLEPAAARQVLDLGAPGVYLQREYRRYYPAGEVTSHLLGFTDIDHVGQEGLELAFDDWLQGVPGRQRVIKDRLGRVVEAVETIRLPQPGRPLVLSIDRRIQYLAYRALKAAVLEHRAAGASAVVLDVTRGEILAMVNQPAGNPNDRRRLDLGLFRNRAVTDVFEPGSTLKPMTVALALENGAYRPQTPIDTRPGSLKVGRNRVRDLRNYGRIDVAEVITKSSNVGISKIALSLPRQDLWQLFTRLGFGVPTGLAFTGEQGGRLSHFSGWGDFEYVTHAFGYGVSVTTLQLAQAYAVLAADGVRRPLSLLRREGVPAQEERVLAANTTRQLRAVLETVVSAEGTAARAAVPGYRVAGKTGTVHKSIDGRYARDRYRALFAGMAPASRPRLVAVVVVDEPRGKFHYGGQVAAPVFSRIMAGALHILDVAPDALPEPRLAVVADPRSRP